MAISTAAVSDARTGVLLRARRRAVFTSDFPWRSGSANGRTGVGPVPQRADIAILPVAWLPPAVGGACAGQTSANGVALPASRYMLVRRLALAASLLFALAGAPAFAQSPAHAQPATPSADAMQANADEAARVVDAFMTALIGGQLETARQLMTSLDLALFVGPNVEAELSALLQAAERFAAPIGRWSVSMRRRRRS